MEMYRRLAPPDPRCEHTKWKAPKGPSYPTFFYAVLQRPHSQSAQPTNHLGIYLKDAFFLCNKSEIVGEFLDFKNFLWSSLY